METWKMLATAPDAILTQLVYYMPRHVMALPTVATLVIARCCPTWAPAVLGRAPAVPPAASTSACAAARRRDRSRSSRQVTRATRLRMSRSVWSACQRAWAMT